MTKFAFLTDIHYGYERRNGHKVPLHDLKAFNTALAFLRDFQPDVLILGGDILDCSTISHHNHGKPGRTEGLRLLQDAEECREHILKPLEALKAKKRIYIVGNHEDWLTDLTDDQPGLEGIVGLEAVLKLDRWQVIPQGGKFHLGKITFVHGDQLTGGAGVARNAVTMAERSIRFGHYHTYAAFTKTSFIDEKLGRTGIAVPALCTKEMKYGQGRGNSWVQGLNHGVVFEDGTFADTISLITNGRMWANGKLYKG